MKQIQINTKCEHCGKELCVTAELPNIPVVTPEVSSEVQAPNVRGNIKPSETIMVYRISSEQIKDFMIKKARKYVPDVLMTIVPRYCEKKRKSNNEPHRSYASLRVAFSENAVANKGDLDWYSKIGENANNVQMHPSILKELIDKYKYNRKDIESWMENYKTLEELEDGLGMTEAYINDLYIYSTPQRVKTNNNENWIIFAAAAENVIFDMLTDENTDKLIGNISIKDIYPISDEIVEFLVYIYPTKTVTKENPHVRQILLGTEKPKK